MPAAFQVNIVITAGVDYNQQFTLTNPDKSPLDITGYTFTGNVSKYPRSKDALLSTAEEPVYIRYPLTTRVVNGVGGIYQISMEADETNKLQEGKYIYSVVMRDGNGELSEAVQGLAFVEIGFGAPPPAPVPQ
tara:strand:+ start:781 stop:1179 length:399 start_codon:yes stop_codon:yes gene_type:complete